ncbi:hipl1 protein [Quercus suber]|uniref:Hipl1 protein n=1 Tax=Quercus suber TaxID=58331 RepID=A0AAW0KNK9_QUESU
MVLILMGQIVSSYPTNQARHGWQHNSDAEFGMLGIAFHPNFQQNGRFFVSFNCDKAKWPDVQEGVHVTQISVVILQSYTLNMGHCHVNIPAS